MKKKKSKKEIIKYFDKIMNIYFNYLKQETVSKKFVLNFWEIFFTDINKISDAYWGFTEYSYSYSIFSKYSETYNNIERESNNHTRKKILNDDEQKYSKIIFENDLRLRILQGEKNILRNAIISGIELFKFNDELYMYSFIINRKKNNIHSDKILDLSLFKNIILTIFENDINLLYKNLEKIS